MLVEEVKKHEGIVVLGCDCNSKETLSSYRLLANKMKNAARQVGWRLHRNEFVNVKQDVNIQHIDYIFFHGQIEPIGVFAIKESGGSDHLPVLAQFWLN